MGGSTKTNTSNNNSSDDNNNSSFSSYSFSDSSIVDDKGRRVSSTTRSYEDSTGRLKAVQEREIGDKKMCKTLNRENQEDEGQQETFCLGGESAEEFEAMWQQTPFGEANNSNNNTLKEHGEQPEQGQHSHQKTEQKSQAPLQDTPMTV
ncbi:hypothetical protein PHYBOEH_012116 [Phytophthora boehmeriae]|uniref:Uncharacterized protein n=1 Tax=Phytophthora boehmeriae TaxID=109152 RepID=A0A8T1VCX8_9STRA|nr:hypothetical protein PHYBOEH_012116 [Phytophthora boehmeriae]